MGERTGFVLFLSGWKSGVRVKAYVLLPQYLSEKSQREFLWVRVLMVAGGTSEGFKWVVEQ